MDANAHSSRDVVSVMGGRAADRISYAHHVRSPKTTTRRASIAVVCQGEVDLEQLRLKVSAGLTALAIDEPVVQITRVERLSRLASEPL